MVTDSVSFTENDIRPDELMRENDRLHAEDLRWLLARRDRFVAVSCPACGADVPRPLWDKDGYAYSCCDSCGTGYLNPRPEQALLEEYYRHAANYRFWQEKVFPASETVRLEQIVRPRLHRIVELCEMHGVVQGTMVEVGAGFGTFCCEAAASGCFSRVVAVEPTPAHAEACRQRQIEVIELPVEKAELPEGADLVASFEVIEHLFDPGAFLRGCARILKPGGLVVITCPNLYGFDVSTLGAVSQVVDPEHLNYFHPDSLSALFAKSGLEVLELATPGKLDAEIVRKRSLAGLFDLSTQPFLRRVLIDEWERCGQPFQHFLADTLLSSHMWIIGRKNIMENV